MRSINIDEARFVYGGDDEASAICESVGDVSAALGGLAGATIGSTSTNPAVSTASTAIGIEVGEAVGEAACGEVEDTWNELMSQTQSFLISAIHGPVNLSVDGY